MPFLPKSKHVRLVGAGGSLPAKRLGNEHFAAYLDTSDEWIAKRTGIRGRRIADDNASICDLAEPAAHAALASARRDVAEIDLVIVATTTPDRIFPATACLLQARLGIRGAAAFDVQAVCSGFVYALGTAAAMISAGIARCALVVGADFFSRLLDWQDRSTCVLFGDGAGAVVLEASETPGLLAISLGADGEHADCLTAPGRVASGKIAGSGAITMDGRAVFKLAVLKMRESCETVCEQAAVAPAEVDWFVPHQANLRIIDAVASRLGLREEAVVRTVAEHANTSAASIPLALAEIWSRVKPGQNILMTAAGGGLTWGAALLRS